MTTLIKFFTFYWPTKKLGTSSCASGISLYLVEFHSSYIYIYISIISAFSPNNLHRRFKQFSSSNSQYLINFSTPPLPFHELGEKRRRCISAGEPILCNQFCWNQQRLLEEKIRKYLDFYMICTSNRKSVWPSRTTYVRIYFYSVFQYIYLSTYFLLFPIGA
jgi:hypothetical protein